MIILQLILAWYYEVVDNNNLIIFLVALPCDGLQSQHKALFTKDSVYHASLCNLVLSIIKKPDELQCCLNKFRHSFINMSVSGKTKVLIAYHENGDIYISFKSTEEGRVIDQVILLIQNLQILVNQL